MEIATWQATHWLTLALTTAAVGGLLIGEHYAAPIVAQRLGVQGGTESGRRLPARWNYAIGLVTDAGLLLLWAAVAQVTVDLSVWAVLLTCMALAGVPDWRVHRREEADRDRELQAAWARLAALQLAGIDPRHYSRAQALLESLCILAGAIAKDRRDMTLILSQLMPLVEMARAGQDDLRGAK